MSSGASWIVSSSFSYQMTICLIFLQYKNILNELHYKRNNLLNDISYVKLQYFKFRCNEDWIPSFSIVNFIKIDIFTTNLWRFTLTRLYNQFINTSIQSIHHRESFKKQRSLSEKTIVRSFIRSKTEKKDMHIQDLGIFQQNME